MNKNKITEQLRWQIVCLLKNQTKTERKIVKLVGVTQKLTKTH